MMAAIISQPSAMLGVSVSGACERGNRHESRVRIPDDFVVRAIAFGHEW
jgi:hypothetical protein